MSSIFPGVFWLALFFWCFTVNAQGDALRTGLTESLQRVSLSRGVALNVMVSKHVDASPDIAVLLFPGYPGILRLREEGGVVAHDLAGNFLMRARRFLNSDRVFTVAVDCPEDQLTACDDAYRVSPRHASDIREVVAAVKSVHGARKVYILGTSYGTVSTSYLAQALEGRIEGAIHTATFTDPGFGGKGHGKPMASFDWTATRLPQLFVHHKDDPCDVTRYASVVARKGDIPLVTVEGVDNPRGGACQAFTAHGFVGRERAVMGAIHGWILDGKAPAVVGASAGG
jgi:pimeloyl-ACP methyl ester carboxylesterase